MNLENSLSQNKNRKKEACYQHRYVNVTLNNKTILIVNLLPVENVTVISCSGIESIITLRINLKHFTL